MSNRGNDSQGSGDSYKPPTTQALQTIIKADAQTSAITTIAEAERLAKYLVAEELKSAQMRLVFSKIRQIEARWTNETTQQSVSMREVLLLKPRLRYQGKRVLEKDKKQSFNVLADVFIGLIDQIEKREEFQRFVDFSEAVVAYHKVYGGKD